MQALTGLFDIFKKQGVNRRIQWQTRSESALLSEIGPVDLHRVSKIPLERMHG